MLTSKEVHERYGDGVGPIFCDTREYREIMEYIDSLGMGRWIDANDPQRRPLLLGRPVTRNYGG